VNRCYRCWTEIDLSALRENLSWIRQRIGPDVKILSVVKADAYGHGLKQIAALLMQSGTDIFGVANLAEAEAIRGVGVGWPILMLGACLPDEVEFAVRDRVMPMLSSYEEAKRFSEVAVRQRATVEAHLKVDTGMGRLGVAPERAKETIERIRRLPGIRIVGLCTHYSSAEDDAEFSRAQREQFVSVVRHLEAIDARVPLIHANNSAALLHEPKSIFNVVRPGLLVYGIVPAGKRMPDSNAVPSVRPALSFFSRVTTVKDIKPGTPLSYGRAYVAPRPMKVATVAAGYGDGYLRAGSGRAEVLIGGTRCPVLGRITMDQILADVTRVPETAPGAEVVLIGRQGSETITASEVAHWCGTIPWEVLTSITYRVPRIYRGAQAA
jgi:alanine racemase